MALDLGTIITAVEAVQKAIEMCKKVEDLPDQMKTLGRRMELQSIVLLQVESFVKKYSKGVNPILDYGQQTDLMRIIGNVKENADKVYELIERVEGDILSRGYNLQFRNKLAARIWFALVEKQPEKIQAIMEDINHDREELSHYVQIIDTKIGAEVLLKLRELEKREKERKKELAKAQARLKLLGESKAKEKDNKKENEKPKIKDNQKDKEKPKETKDNKSKDKEKEKAQVRERKEDKSKDKEKTKEKDRDKSPGPSKQNQQSPPPPASPSKALELIVPIPTAAKKRRPSPSPSPLPRRQDYKILFVDPRNQARSIVAQSIVLLLGGLTTATASSAIPWRIAQVHSAGFFVSNKSTLTRTISSLSYSYKSYKMDTVPGNELPNPVALASVFDNNSYPYPFKSTIQTRMTNHRSVGLTENAFKNYDYIIVFTNREHDNMVRLKDALIQSGKISAREKGGKGRVLHLGTYLPQKNGKPKEILTVPGKVDPVTREKFESREDWNKKAGEIKTALKAFLKEEMGWVMPYAGVNSQDSKGKKDGEDGKK